MKFWRCFFYLVIISVIAFFVGRLLPKSWFRANKPPYRTCRFEKEGRIYEKLHIRKWQNKLPDMSKILPFMMPPKSLAANCETKLPRMIQETCVAEFIHGMNCLVSLYCLKLFSGIGGVIIVLLYAVLFNIPYIIIQRYNRPRLIKLLKRFEERAKPPEERHVRSTER